MDTTLEPPFGRIAICGFGLIGGSLARAIRRRWPSIRIVAIDKPAVVAEALRTGAADAGGGDVAAAEGCGLGVLAAPISVNVDLLPRLAAALPADALITDTGSTKRDIVAAAAPLGRRFTGGHPIAGAATRGLGHATADLFAGRPWILTPASADVPPSLRDLVAGIGADVRVMTPDVHDRLVSAISHLPQLTASALMQVVGESAGEAGLALAGPGLRDTTRLAGSPAGVWRDIAAANRDHLARDLDALISALGDLRRDLDGATGALDRTFDSAARWKRALEARPKPQ